MARYPVLGLTALTLLVAGSAAPADGAPEALQVVLEQRADGAIQTVSTRPVALVQPLRSLAGAEMARAFSRRSRLSDVATITVYDPDGEVAFQNVATVARWLRGEFHGSEADEGATPIDGRVIPADPIVFTVQVPRVAGGTLVVEAPIFGQVALFDLDRIDPAARERASGPMAVPLPGWSNGDPGNRLDLLILGDGYTLTQEAQFESHALDLVEQFLSVSPYREYRNFVNAYALFTPSAESGADHPPYVPGCSEYALVQSCCGEFDPDGPRFVDTVLGATFCSYNTQRLVTVNFAAAIVYAAAALPEVDQILVMVNDPAYGGSGGVFSVISRHPLAVEIAQHEFGHTFTLLADEYEAPYPGYPPCSDLPPGPPCESNVTTQTNAALLKWKHWVDPSTPIPTISPEPLATAAGLWQGARYLFSGMYRQGYNCAMRSLAAPFCDVASEAFALRLYGGSWGHAAEGVDPIEPGSETPPAGALSVAAGGSVALSANLVGPIDGPDLAVRWLIDDEVAASTSLPTGSTASFTYVDDNCASKSVDLEVADQSPILHDLNRTVATGRRRWQIGCALCPGGLAAERPRLKITGAATAAADDTLVITSELVFATPPILTPEVDGARVQVRDAAGRTLLDAAIPGGAYDPSSKTGWKVSSGGKRTFTSPTPVGGAVRKLIINPKTPTMARLVVRGRSGSFANGPVTLPLAATVLLDGMATTTNCGHLSFPGPHPAPACAASGGRIVCK